SRRRAPSSSTCRRSTACVSGWPCDVLSPRMLRVIEDLAGDWRRLDERIEGLSSKIEALARQDKGCERLMSVPGFAHGLDGLLARRGEQADQAKEDEISRQGGGGRGARPPARVLRAKGAPDPPAPAR